MKHWKEEYDRKFPTVDHQYPGLIKNYIEEIIEKLIEDIPDLDTWVDGVNVAPVVRSIKDQLRDKWL